MSKKRIIVTAIILALVLVIGGILAYFTDVQTKHNKFTTGKVEILVDEPSWPGNPITNPEYDPDTNPDVPPTIEPEVPVVPNQEVNKDPQVTNLGTGEVYAFAEVIVPVKNVKIGSSQTAAPTQLFTFVNENGTAGINAGWIEVSHTPTTLTAETENITYVFAYATHDTTTDKDKLTALTTNQTTAKPVFSKVKFADVTESEYTANGMQNQQFEVTVNGYGIQKEGLNSTEPAVVWPEVK